MTDFLTTFLIRAKLNKLGLVLGGKEYPVTSAPK